MLLDASKSKPIFQQIAEFIEDMIINGDLEHDSQVYSTNQLSKLFTINPATARKGLNILLDQEIIYKKRGIGMFVSVDATSIILDKRKSHFFHDYMETMLVEAKKLGLNKEDILHLVEDFEWR